VITNQRVQQAELGINSAKAQLDLARSQFNNTLDQTEQALKVVEDSAIVEYNSAYNNINQAFLFLNEGTNLDDIKYIYREVSTYNTQLRTDTEFLFIVAATKYLEIPSTLDTNDDLVASLNHLQVVLETVKNVLDNTAVLLHTTILYYGTDITLNATYQASINQHVSAVINSINNINNTKITNRLQINNAQANLDLAEINFNNADIGLANAKEGASLEINIAQTQLDNVAYSYNNLTLAAPFSGTIISHAVNPGEQVSIGQELIEIGNLSIIEIPVDIDASFAEAIKLNDSVMINDQYAGVVTEIEPVGNLTSGKISITVQSEEAKDNLVSGSIADVKFNLNYQTDNLIVIPIKSVTIEATGNYVFVIEDGIIVRRDVNLGQIFGNQVSVTSGLNENDQLVLLNGVFVAAGDEVEIME